MRKQLTSFVLGIALALSSLWVYSATLSKGVEVRFVPSKPGAASGHLIANVDGKWIHIAVVGGQLIPTQ